MEIITLTIKKPYAKEVIADLEKMDAITIEKVAVRNPSDFIGSWMAEPLAEPLAEIDRNIDKIKAEWR